MYASKHGHFARLYHYYRTKGLNPDVAMDQAKFHITLQKVNNN